jgi:peroxiredoxin
MSFILPAGASAPDFELLGSDGKKHSFRGANGIQGKSGTLVFFTCNHCPHVIGSEDRMRTFFTQCESLGISMVAVHSNETKDHNSDSFEQVIIRMREQNFKWLSLQDEAQTVALAFGAERTPHYFLFGKDGRLAYSGRMDNSPRDLTKVSTHELQDAMEEMRADKPISVPQTAPIGCNIKWWDKEKHWMPKEACDLDYLYLRKETST